MKSVQRIFEVIKLFDHERRPLSSTEVGRALDFPMSSTLLLLKSMSQIGMLALDRRTKNYFPTPELKYLVDWVDTKLMGSNVLTPLLNDLHAATQETIALSLLQDLDMIFVHIMTSARPVALTVAVGSSHPANESTVGWAALAQLDRPDFDAVADRLERRAIARHDAFDASALVREVDVARRAGFAVGYGRVSPDAGAVAMPIPSRLGGVQYVVGVAGPSERIRAHEAQIIATMRRLINHHVKRP